MKKLLALLMACATMTCAFASCGDDEADSSSTSSESSVSESSEEETEEDTTEEVTEEDTTEEADADDADILEEDGEETTAEIETPTYEFIEDADKTAFLGKWECEKMIIEGEEATELMGLPLYAVYQIEVMDDGTAVMGESLNDINESEEDVSVTCEWGVVSDTEMAIINEVGYAMLFTLEDGYLVVEEEGYDQQIYFKNVEEFTPFDYEAFMAEFQEGLEESGDIEWTTDDESVADDTEVADTDTVDEESVDDTSESVAE